MNIPRLIELLQEGPTLIDIIRVVYMLSEVTWIAYDFDPNDEEEVNSQKGEWTYNSPSVTTYIPEEKAYSTLEEYVTNKKEIAITAIYQKYTKYDVIKVKDFIDILKKEFVNLTDIKYGEESEYVKLLFTI